MAMLRLTGLVLALAGLSGQAAPDRYVAGQVWEYRARPQDFGSLLKVQRVGLVGQNKVYHISVIGVHFATAGMAGVLPHIPVSNETLDASVTNLSTRHAVFPTTALDEGIAEWQRANGGVFTITMSDIVGIIDDQTAQAQGAVGKQPTGSYRPLPIS